MWLSSMCLRFSSLLYIFIIFRRSYSICLNHIRSNYNCGASQILITTSTTTTTTEITGLLLLFVRYMYRYRYITFLPMALYEVDFGMLLKRMTMMNTPHTHQIRSNRIATYNNQPTVFTFPSKLDLSLDCESVLHALVLDVHHANHQTLIVFLPNDCCFFYHHHHLHPIDSKSL